MTRPVHLVACVGQKLPQPARADNLYQSDWFRKARAYVTAQGGRWFILSALHGLVPPSRLIEPYNVTLGDMTAAERRAWGERVSAQLVEQIGHHNRVHARPISHARDQRLLLFLDEGSGETGGGECRLGHRALDRDLHGNQITVFNQRWNLERHAPHLGGLAAQNFIHGLRGIIDARKSI